MEKLVSLRRRKGPFCITRYKQELLRDKKDWKCSKCGKHHRDKNDLILDHIIPVKVGGPRVIWDKSNMQILCYLCDGKKLGKDMKIIKEMVRKNFFTKGSSSHMIYVSEEKCIEYYKERFANIIEK